MKKNVLCIVGALFGRPFMVEAQRQGWNVYLLTEEKYLKDAWPREVLSDVWAVKDLYDEKVVRNVVCFISRSIKFDKIVGLGEFDIEVAADLREHTRIPGMGETTARHFRDKLAMRQKAKSSGIMVPEFVRILNHEEVREFMERVPAPWIFKPRMGASSAKVQKIYHQQELWEKIHELGDKQTSYLLEQYIAGDVFHVDSLISDRTVPYASVSQYGLPMLDLNTTGGIFTSRQIAIGSADEVALQKINRDVITAFGLVAGSTHIEYIKGKEDGEMYFLEAGARIGGARIPDIVWRATGICLWHEWAKIELKPEGDEYVLPPHSGEYGAGIFTLSREDHPDLSAYNDVEVCWVQNKKNYAGLILRSSDPERLESILKNYYPRFVQDFMAHVPAK